MDGINTKKSEVLKVLIMKIQCDVCWNQHIFQCLIFLKRGKIFLSSYYLRHLHTKENGIQLSRVVRGLNVYLDINGSRVSNSTDSLEHCCNLACISLFTKNRCGLVGSVSVY